MNLWILNIGLGSCQSFWS